MTAKFYVENGTLEVHNLTPGSAADSLAKWETLLALAEDGELVHDGGCRTCAFCQAHRGLEVCRDCPISLSTGCAHCAGTAYRNYAEAVYDDCIEIATEAASDMVNLLADIWRNEQ